MKKIIALLIAGLMVLSFAACKPGTGNENTDETTTAGSTTVAGTYVEEFKKLAADDTLTAEDIATKLYENVTNPIMGLGVMPVEEGLLAGFENYEVKGFSEGATLQNMMMGGAAFITYVFKLADGTDAEAFKTGLLDNANLRWNICTAADEMACEVVGNTVFFIMAPLSFEQPEEETEGEVEGGDIGGMEGELDGPAAFDPEADTTAEETTAA